MAASNIWAPSGEAIAQQLELLQALSNPSQHNHLQSLAALETLVTHPEWILTVSHIFAAAETGEIVCPYTHERAILLPYPASPQLVCPTLMPRHELQHKSES